MPAFDVTEYRASVCESCHQSELLLLAVEFSDGAIFKVCSRCRDEAHRLLRAVFQ